MSELIISVSGLRGIIGETLTPDVAMRYAAAFSQSVKKKGLFVITRDSRPSGKMLTDAICAALNAAGRETYDGFVAATPTTGILIKHFKAAGGIQISASHNPGEFNGMKLFSAEGRVIPKEPGSKVLETYNAIRTAGAGTNLWQRYDKLAGRRFISDSYEPHLPPVLETVDVKKIKKRKFNVVLDSNHGAGAVLGMPLLKALGCNATVLGEEPDGNFLHTPEPTPINLAGVAKQAKKLNADIIFCQDPDADRLAVIDENGRYIGEEYTLALCVEHILSRRLKSAAKNNAKANVVINCATSRMTEDIAAKYGAKVFRSAVGEANVVDLMLEKKAIFGGEGNGGPINPAVGYVRDSFAGMALILDYMAAAGRKISELADALPKYALVKRKAPADLAKVPELLDKVAKHYKSQNVDRLDGVRITYGDAWVLLRGSNTEAIIRVFAEAPTAARANALCDEIENVLKRS
ncbi:MAG: phosphoglucosamine mutase [Planctomycetaceae bacterium]|jgi:phosphomannomutase|nr:phosphoglucosamine mutase [Planctomycetaceae bacterium]